MPNLLNSVRALRTLVTLGTGVGFFPHLGLGLRRLRSQAGFFCSGFFSVFFPFFFFFFPRVARPGDISCQEQKMYVAQASHKLQLQHPAPSVCITVTTALVQTLLRGKQCNAAKDLARDCWAG